MAHPARFPKVGWVGLAIVGVFVVVAITAPWISPYPAQARVVQTLQNPSLQHPFGTNQIGQDLVSQLIAGTRVSLLVAAVAGGLAVLIGTLVGVTAGWLGGWADAALMRLTDIALALPRLPLLLVLGVYAGKSLTSLALVIAALFWPGTARVVRGQVQTLRSRAYVKASIGFGAGAPQVVRRHIIPDIALLAAAAFVTSAGRAILLESGLAFLGLGDPSRVSWGTIMRDARISPGIFYTKIWIWWMLPPVVAIFLLLLGTTFIGTAFEQVVNPRLVRHDAVAQMR